LSNTSAGLQQSDFCNGLPALFEALLRAEATGVVEPPTAGRFLGSGSFSTSHVGGPAMSRGPLLVASLLTAAGCAATARPTLDLAADPARLTIVQKHSKPIPGLEGAAAIRIYDIRWGKVLFEIVGEGGRTIVDTVSVKRNDVVPFMLGGRKYYVRVVELKNVFAGDDHGVFEVTTQEPAQNRGPQRKAKKAH